MVTDGDPRPQLVLLNIFKDRPKLVAMARDDQASVGPVVRQALQALGDPNDAEANRGFRARINELLAVKYFVPDSVEPKNESKRRSKWHGDVRRNRRLPQGDWALWHCRYSRLGVLARQREEGPGGQGPLREGRADLRGADLGAAALLALREAIDELRGRNTTNRTSL